MSASAWAMMLATWTTISAFTTWFFVRVLRTPQSGDSKEESR